jgi:hypothetical protein
MINNHFKKVRGKWLYYPFTEKMKPDIFMEVKEGQKEDFIDAIFDMRFKSFALLGSFGLLILFSPYLFLASFIFWVFFVILIGKRNERQYCHYKKYNNFAFLDNFFINFYKSIDIDNRQNIKDLIICAVVFGFLSYIAYLQQGFSIWTGASIGFFIICIFILFLTLLKKQMGSD